MVDADGYKTFSLNAGIGFEKAAGDPCIRRSNIEMACSDAQIDLLHIAGGFLESDSGIQRDGTVEYVYTFKKSA